MDFRDVILAQHARAHTAAVGQPDLSLQDGVLRDVTDDQIRLRPTPGLNPLAWVIWHMTRLEDIGANLVIAEQAQVADADGWLERLNVARRDFGAGMTAPEVDALAERIDVAALLDYRVAVGRRTRQIVRDVPPGTLAEVIDADLIRRVHDAGAFPPNAPWAPARWEGKQKSFTLANTVLAHSYVHWGEATTIRVALGLDYV